jgi:hypothetical protein
MAKANVSNWASCLSFQFCSFKHSYLTNWCLTSCRWVFWLKMEIPRMIWGFPLMTVYLLRYFTCVIFSEACLVLGLVVHYYLLSFLYSHRLYLVFFPKTEILCLLFRVYRLKMDLAKGRTLWCLSCLPWERSRSVPLRTLAQKIEYDAIAVAVADGKTISFMLLTRIFIHYACVHQTYKTVF